MELLPIYEKMGILFFLILVGFLAAKGRVLPEGSNRVLSQLVIFITNPCTVLYSALSGERLLSNGQVLLLTSIAVGAFGVMILLGRLLPMLLRCPEKDRNLYRFLCTFSNMGFLGFPVVEAVFGPDAVFYAAIFNLVFQLVVYTYGVSLFRPGERLEPKLLLSPMIFASLLAYACYLTGLRVPAPVTEALKTVSNVNSPLCMLAIGIALAGVPLREVFGNWRLYVIALVRQLLLPLVLWLALRSFVTEPLVLGVTVVICAMPAATLTVLFSAKYGGNEKLAAAGVFLTTLLSLGTIPLLTALL